MLLKKHLKLSLIGIKAQHFAMVVPIFVSCILVPTIVFFLWRSMGMDYSLRTNIASFTQIFLPFFSLWWVFFSLREYVEGEGCELLYVYDKSGQIMMVLFTWLAYIVVCIPPYIVYCIMFGDLALEFVRIVFQSILLLGLFYLIISITCSAAISMIPMIIYFIVSVLFGDGRVIYYYSTLDVVEVADLKVSAIQAAVGVVFLLLGIMVNSVYQKAGLRK